MRRKGVVVIGFITLLFAFVTFQSCKSTPEKQLLSTYFHAISLNDTMTMSTMSLEPAKIDVESWKIASVSPDKTEPFTLAELSQKELELKKKLEDHVAPVTEADDALYVAQEEQKAARTAGARAAAKKKVEAAQAKFDEEREIHRELQKDYNEAKAAAAKEEQIALFSLNLRQLPTIRDLTGTVLSKDVDVAVVGKDGQTTTYRFYLRKYDLKDEAANITHRGRWVIVRFEPVT
jgi:hypothetical protein